MPPILRLTSIQNPKQVTSFRRWLLNYRLSVTTKLQAGQAGSAALQPSIIYLFLLVHWCNNGPPRLPPPRRPAGAADPDLGTVRGLGAVGALPCYPPSAAQRVRHDVIGARNADGGSSARILAHL